MEASSPPAPNIDPAAALREELERLRDHADELEQELAAEREHSASLEVALERQRQARSRLHDEAARLRTRLEQGGHDAPPPAWDDRPVNPSLRTKWRWITRVLVVLVFLVVLGAAYLLVHGYIHNESIGHVWGDVRNFF
jgi:hypothetical protein